MAANGVQSDYGETPPCLRGSQSRLGATQPRQRLGGVDEGGLCQRDAAPRVDAAPFDVRPG